MEAQLVDELPEGDGWQFEPKWDGFRGIAENLDGEFHLWSRNGRPLLRYFPELESLGELLPPRSAVGSPRRDTSRPLCSSLSSVTYTVPRDSSRPVRSPMWARTATAWAPSPRCSTASMTSVSPEAVQMCRENGIAVIPGSCPNQFLQPDFGHKLMRMIMRMLGFLRVTDKGVKPNQVITPQS